MGDHTDCVRELLSSGAEVDLAKVSSDTILICIQCIGSMFVTRTLSNMHQLGVCV